MKKTYTGLIALILGSQLHGMDPQDQKRKLDDYSSETTEFQESEPKKAKTASFFSLMPAHFNAQLAGYLNEYKAIKQLESFNENNVPAQCDYMVIKLPTQNAGYMYINGIKTRAMVNVDSITICKGSSGEKIFQYSFETPVKTHLFSQDQKRLAIVSDKLYIVNLASGNETKEIIIDSPQKCSDIAFNRSGDTIGIYSGTEKKLTQIVPLEEPLEVASLLQDCFAKIGICKKLS